MLKQLRFTFLILLSFGLSAQDSGTQSIFMEAGLGARAQGLGKAFVASANDGSAIYWNPAGLDFLPQANFSAYHSTLIQGVYYNFATLTFPLVQFGSVGVGAAHFGVSGINITDLEAYTIGTGDYSEEEYYFSYGKKLPWYGLAFGTTFKITHQSASDPAGGVLQTRSATGSGLDLALMWRPDFASSALSGLSFGLNVQNVVAPSVKLINKTYTDPRMVRVGLAKDFLFGNDQLRRFTILADVNKGSRSKAELNLGAEYSFSRFLAARAGFNNGQLSFGMGTEFTQFQKFSVDYSVNIGTPFGTPLHRLSLTVNFGKTIDERLQIAKATRVDEDRKLVVSNQEAAKSRAIKEHQVMGTELLKNKKLIPALVELEQVVALDPKNENAQRMLDTVRSLMDQQLADQLADTAKQMKELTVNSENRKFVDDHYRKGYAYIQKGDYIAAISEFTTALERSPDNSDIKKSLSETRGLLDKKIASFIAKARASAAGNNFAEALKLLTEARGLDPTNQQIQKEIDGELKRVSTRLSFLESTRSGLDAYQKGDFQIAMEEFEKALLLDPSNETVKEYHKKAIVRAFATFKNLEGDVEKIYLQGVDMYVEGKYEVAISMWQRILEKDPLNKRVIKAIDKAEEQIRTRNESKKKK